MPQKKVDVPMLFKLWGDNVPQPDICDRLGIPPGSFWGLRKRYALPKRECDRRIDFTETEPPTPEEIAERAAIVRAGWTEAERERRIVGRPATPVRLRTYAFSPREFATALD